MCIAEGEPVGFESYEEFAKVILVKSYFGGGEVRGGGWGMKLTIMRPGNPSQMSAPSTVGL